MTSAQRHPAATAVPSSSHATATMRANRGRDTSPELAIRTRLHRAGLRYRVDHRMTLDGMRIRPDIVFVRARVAVFIDGCFWHACPVHGELPQANRSFWRRKLDANARRDARQTAVLEKHGWIVVRIWEHEAVEAGAGRVSEAVRSR